MNEQHDDDTDPMDELLGIFAKRRYWAFPGRQPSIEIKNAVTAFNDLNAAMERAMKAIERKEGNGT